MAANMWKNSLKNVESDNNKILYKTLLDFFYSETVLTFWISPIIAEAYGHFKKYSKYKSMVNPQNLTSFEFAVYSRRNKTVYIN